VNGRRGPLTAASASRASGPVGPVGPLPKVIARPRPQTVKAGAHRLVPPPAAACGGVLTLPAADAARISATNRPAPTRASRGYTVYLSGRREGAWGGQKGDQLDGAFSPGVMAALRAAWLRPERAAATLGVPAARPHAGPRTTSPPPLGHALPAEAEGSDIDGLGPRTACTAVVDRVSARRYLSDGVAGPMNQLTGDSLPPIGAPA
jgi:hypothetical protein